MSSGNKSRPSSLLEVPSAFFDGARLVSNGGGELLTRHGNAAEPSRSSPSEVSSSQLDTLPQSSMNRWACNTCGNLEFSSLDEQRFHFKSDFHRFNVKRKLIGKDPISEEGFEILADGQHQKDDDVSSISGSDEEDSDSNNEEEATHLKSFSASKSQNYISVMLQPSDEIATIWKCVVLNENEKIWEHDGKLGIASKGVVSEEALLQRLMKLICKEGLEGNHLWVIVLLRGGHFAACVFDFKKGSILAHKTFHRYVVRAKAGGKQSTKDGTGRAPKSAGATLRRHNEASLQREIRELLVSWKSFLETASHIFVHAPSRNSHVLFGGDNAPLKRNDERVRNVPFTTRRPTFKESKRTFNELISVTYQNLESVDVADSTSSSKSSSKEPPKESLVGLGTEKVIKGMNRVAEPSCSYDELRKETGTLSDSAQVDMQVEVSTTPLHHAARLGDVHLVLELLEEGANPCARDDRGRTPYNLAADKETRNVFRKFMGANLEKWDWHAANVPSALTDEMEAAQAAKQAEKDAKRKAKAKEQKKLRKEKQKAREMTAAASSEKLENTIKSTQNSNSAVTQDEKKRAEAIEREKRALAAERRIMALSFGSVASPNGDIISKNKQDGPCCSNCGVSLAGMTPFYRLSFQYCTTTCVHIHRRALEC